MYKLTVVLNEENRKYVDILQRRFRLRNKDILIDELIKEKVASLFA